jgi:hypothetical protein
VHPNARRTFEHGRAEWALEVAIFVRQRVLMLYSTT